jgi:hypothetical protein
MIAQSLANIAAAMEDLARQAEAEHPIDPFELIVLAKQVAAQSEMLAQGLEE